MTQHDTEMKQRGTAGMSQHMSYIPSIILEHHPQHTAHEMQTL